MYLNLYTVNQENFVVENFCRLKFQRNKFLSLASSVKFFDEMGKLHINICMRAYSYRLLKIIRRFYFCQYSQRRNIFDEIFLIYDTAICMLFIQHYLDKPYFKACQVMYEKLSETLPIEDLLPKLVSAGVIPRSLKKKMDAALIESDRVKLMLDKMLDEMNAKVYVKFVTLIDVMKEYCEDENDRTVKALLQDIYDIIGNTQPAIQPVLTSS